MTVAARIRTVHEGATRHEEIERTYAVETDTGLPAFGVVDAVAKVGLPGETDVDAAYFDTPHLDLLRHGITVRRRVGGHDQGWHLKQPSGPDARAETRDRLLAPTLREDWREWEIELDEGHRDRTRRIAGQAPPRCCAPTCWTR